MPWDPPYYSGVIRAERYVFWEILACEKEERNMYWAFCLLTGQLSLHLVPTLQTCVPSSSGPVLEWPASVFRSLLWVGKPLPQACSGPSPIARPLWLLSFLFTPCEYLPHGWNPAPPPLPVGAVQASRLWAGGAGTWLEPSSCPASGPGWVLGTYLLDQQRNTVVLGAAQCGFLMLSHFYWNTSACYWHIWEDTNEMRIWETYVDRGTPLASVFLCVC